MIQHRFTIGDYTDALYFPLDQVPDDAAVAALEQARYDNWMTARSSVPPPLTREQKEALRESLLQQRAILDRDLEDVEVDLGLRTR
jgi:hypothetical protein